MGTSKVDWIQTFFNWCLQYLTKNNLIMATLVGAIILIIIFYIIFYRKGLHDFFGSSVIGTISLMLALTTSYVILFQTVDSSTYKFLTFISPWIIFLINVFARMLILFWIFGIIYGFFKPGQVEVGIKIFGVELSHKYSQEDLYNARIGHDRLKTQLSIIDKLSKETIEYLITPFEPDILTKSQKYDIIRGIVDGILTRVYLQCSGTNIYVLPLTDETLNTIEPPLGPIIRKTHLESHEEDTTDVIEDIYGFGLHYGSNGLSTIIIIDVSKTNGYHITRSEINLASTLFTSISSIIAWAEYQPNEQDEIMEGEENE